MSGYSQEVIVFLIASNLIVAGLGIFIFFVMRIQQKRKILHKAQLIEREFNTRQETILKISRDLHDDVGASLSGISLFAQMAVTNLGNDNSSVERSLNYINQHTQLVIERTADLVWMLQPQNNTESKYLERLKNYASTITQSKAIELVFIVADDFRLPVSQLDYYKNIYLVCKEAINNAVKYSGCHQLNLIFKNNEISISDDGIGFTADKITSGNGLRNMHQRAEESGFQLKINSSNGRGTSVSITLSK